MEFITEADWPYGFLFSSWRRDSEVLWFIRIMQTPTKRKDVRILWQGFQPTKTSLQTARLICFHYLSLQRFLSIPNELALFLNCLWKTIQEEQIIIVESLTSLKLLSISLRNRCVSISLYSIRVNLIRRFQLQMVIEAFRDALK